MGADKQANVQAPYRRNIFADTSLLRLSICCRNKGTASDAAGAASILASLVSLRVIPQIPADKQSAAPSSPDDDEGDLEGDEQDAGMLGDAVGGKETTEAVARRAPLLRHPGVEVDPEAHGPALRELSRLFSTGTGLLMHACPGRQMRPEEC